MSAIGYQANVCLTNGDRTVMQSIKLRDKEELDQVKGFCKDRTNMAGWAKSSIMVIRTDEPGHFLLDLMAPFLNGVTKVDNIALSIFLFAPALVLDFVTLPLRLLTLIPRMAYNYNVQSRAHPLTTFLKEKGLAPHNQIGQLEIELEEKQYTGEQFVLSLPTEGAPIQVPFEGYTSKKSIYHLELARKESPIYLFKQGTATSTHTKNATADYETIMKTIDRPSVSSQFITW